MVNQQLFNQLLTFFSTFKPTYGAEGYVSKGNKPNIPNPGDVKIHIQDPMLRDLRSLFPGLTWDEERKIANPLTGGISRNDKVDIVGVDDPSALSKKDVTVKSGDTAVIVELDSVRAEQVAKKFLSRIALCRESDLVYVAWIYPTHNSKVNYNELRKYFDYCKAVSNQIDKSKREIRFIGVICTYNASANTLSLAVYQ